MFVPRLRIWYGRLYAQFTEASFRAGVRVPKKLNINGDDSKMGKFKLYEFKIKIILQ